MAFKFEKLEVWKESVDLSDKIHSLTRSFPKEELYILTSQLKRAADSVSLNIAEGSTGQTNAEFRRFLGFAIRSGIEVVGCLHLAKHRHLISSEDFETVYMAVDNLFRRIQALRKSISLTGSRGQRTVD